MDVAHMPNFSAQETETRDLGVQDQPRSCSETLSQRTKPVN